MTQKMIKKLSGFFPRSRFAKDTKGVAAVEFAIIAPILILLFVMTLEISYAVAVDRKISRVSSSVADLITQGEEFTKAELTQLMSISERIMYPYNSNNNNPIAIAVSSIQIDSSKNATVVWSHGLGAATLPAKNSTIAVPDNIKVADTFLISANVTIDHKPAFAFVGYQNGGLTTDTSIIALEEQMFLRPRLGGSGVACTDC